MSDTNGEGDKKRTGKLRVAVLGYGDEGREQAMRLRAAGHDVVVAVRPGGMSWVRAMADGFRPSSHGEAVASADVVAMTVPEAEQPALYSSSVAPNLAKGALLVFSHAAPIYTRALEPKSSVDVVLVTRRGSEDLGTRRGFVAVHRDATGSACTRAIAYARAAFGDVAACVETTTFAEQTAMDLSEQALRTGGAMELLATWEKLLASAGHEPDEACLAYYERLKQFALESASFRTDVTAQRGVA